MTDVLLFHTIDDGEITATNGAIATTDGHETAVYLSLFGGNFDDDGSRDNPLQWWGNFGETDPARTYRSETQYLLESTPPTSGNLRRIEAAVKRDLAWLGEYVESVTVSTPRLNAVHITVTIAGKSLSITQPWQARA
jgi:phage gp46-like protein